MSSIRSVVNSFVVNTTEGEQAMKDSASIRSSAIQYNVCYTTTLAGAKAACRALGEEPPARIHSLQQLYS